MKNQTVLVLDFGGQYKELIARRVRECHVYSLVKSGQITADEIRAINPIGIIFTGGPDSVYKPGAPLCDKAIFSLGIPILGICYGMQLICHMHGGTVEGCTVSEYGKTDARVTHRGRLFKGLSEKQTVLMSHTDYVSRIPEGFKPLAETADCPYAAVSCKEKKLYGVQFHPEVMQTEHGTDMLQNFLVHICGAVGDFNMDNFAAAKIKEIRAAVGEHKVLLALSGGVDSSVAAALLSKAIGKQLVCVFVDHGFMRKNEGDEIEAAFQNEALTFVRVNAEQRFLTALAGVSEPEEKRKRIGKEFISVFEDEAKHLQDVKILAQGTIYPDIIESGADGGANIKSHHNVGGLPSVMAFDEIIEPLSQLFKDEVRVLGRMLGLPKSLVERQPFPGPGLAIRIIGDLTKEKLDLLRDADAIVREELNGERDGVSQYFAVLTNIRSVGVMGDERTYDYTVAVRAVTTQDFMTCEYTRLPHERLARISSRIVREVKNVNRVVFDITDKPPATIEWE